MATRPLSPCDEIVFDNDFSDTEEIADIPSVHKVSTNFFPDGEPEVQNDVNLTEALNDRLQTSADRQTNTGGSKVGWFGYKGEDCGVLMDNNQPSFGNPNGLQTIHTNECINEKSHDSQQNYNKIRHDLSNLSEERVFTSGWELLDEDLMCLPLDSFACSKTDRATRISHESKKKSNKLTKRGTLRLLNKRSKSGAYGSSSRIKYSSVMGIITSYAKSHGVDVASLLEQTENVFGANMNMRLPCMQCFEKQGGGGDVTGITSLMESLGGSITEAGDNGNRCTKCGGQVHTLASFGKMISSMRTVLQEKDLIPHDVYPDGNCVFAAVVDQLRIRGDFSFTMHTLRDAAIQYLREHPNADDGVTPLDMFLTDNETWETYLTRMSEDGEWGDHMMLRALVNVTGIPIAIYGGMSGQEETLIYPATSYEDGQLAADKLGDMTIFIYLGHVSESHYISLRPKGWKQKLYDDMKMRATKETSLDERCPVQRIDFILRQAFRMEYIKSRNSESVERFVPNEYDSKGYFLKMVGSVICMMVPSRSQNDGCHDISVFFPSKKEDDPLPFSGPPLVTFLEIPYDTKIVFADVDAKRFDLVAENYATSKDHLCLFPKTPDVWNGQTENSSDNRICLKTFSLDTMDYESLNGLLPSHVKENMPEFHIVIAFQSSWPIIAAEWPDRQRPASFPDANTVKMIVQDGCHVIAYTEDSSLDDLYDFPAPFRKPTDDHTWCYTFAAAEKEICRFLSSEQRQCFLLFKFWVDTATRETSIPNSVLKSTFFHACEHIDKQLWKANPGECLLILLKKLVGSLKQSHAPQYFLTNKNLLEVIPTEDISKWHKQLQVTLLQPVVTLYFVLDQLDILSSELGGFVEEIIDDIGISLSNSSEKSHFREALIPACSTLISNLIYQTDYQSAMCILQDLAEEGVQSGDTETKYVDVIKKTCWDMFIGDQWCFAFYLDIRLKTSVTRKLCQDYASVHITEVFGPDCTEELPDTCVPEIFCISNGDTLFAYKVSVILSQSASAKMFIKSFKFYLKKYAELAGDAIVLPCANMRVSDVYDIPEVQKQMLKAVDSMMTGSSLLHYLENIYVTLFNTCDQSNQVEEFRELMPMMTKIVNESNGPLSRKNLKLMWTALGEKQKAAQIKVSSSSKQKTVDKLLGLLEFD